MPISLPKKFKLPKIKREDLVLTGLLVIALAIPLTVGLTGVRQEFRKRAAGTRGSVRFVDSAGREIATTNTLNVTIRLTAPSSRASLNSSPFALTSTAYAFSCKDECQKEGYEKGYGWYRYEDGCPSEYQGQSVIPLDVGFGLCCCVGAGAAPTPTPPQATPTPTPSEDCICTAWEPFGCGGWRCALNERHYSRTCDIPELTATSCVEEKCVPDSTCPGVPSTPTPTPPCTCTEWEDVRCGAWVCADDAMHQHRSCTPSGCDTINRCPWDQRCAGQAPTPTPPKPTPTPIPIVTKVMVSNYPDFKDAKTANWPFSASSWEIPWTLVKERPFYEVETRSVFAKFQWSDGGWTSFVSDSIEVDTNIKPTPTPTPTATPTPPAPPPPTPTPTPTPTPGPISGETGTAHCDRISVCDGGHCGASSGHCDPNLYMYGHDSERADVAFRVLAKQAGSGAWRGDTLRTTLPGYENGLLSQNCDGEPTGSSRDSGPPYTSCSFHIYTYGAGGYSLSQLLGYPTGGLGLQLGEESVTWTVRILVSSVETDDYGYRTVVGNWDDGDFCETNFTISYALRSYGGGRYVCTPGSDGEFEEYEMPVISNLRHTISGDTGSRGYANMSINFDTDIEADCKVYWELWTDTDYGAKWQTGLSTGTSHSLALQSDTLWYSAESPKFYRYRVRCASAGNYNAPGARVYSDYVYFTLPSGGGYGGAPLEEEEADLNESGGLDIGDWSALTADYGQEGEDLPCDFNHNGECDILDVSAFIDAYRRYAQ